MTPLKFNPSQPAIPPPRSRSVTTSPEMLDGISASPTAGTSTCPVITSATPASTPARMGTDSTVFHSSQATSNVGNESWVSTEIRPMPGKCLMVAAKPAL